MGERRGHVDCTNHARSFLLPGPTSIVSSRSSFSLRSNSSKTARNFLPISSLVAELIFDTRSAKYFSSLDTAGGKHDEKSDTLKSIEKCKQRLIVIGPDSVIMALFDCTFFRPFCPIFPVSCPGHCTRVNTDLFPHRTS